MLDISIKTNSNELQRYNTLGDYQSVDGKTEITVSDMGDWRMEFLVAYMN